ncbi:MAG: hypothetical protein JWO36_3756 [Myxococcales bacterium]|nr:hypothetical protein [Myxococcales bacterium]
MKFRRQLLIGYTALLFVLIVTGTSSVLALRLTTSRLDVVTNDLASEIVSLQRLRFQAEQIVAASRGYLLTGNDAYQRKFDRTVNDLRGTLAALDHHRSELPDQVHGIAINVDDYIAAAQQAVARRSIDPQDLLAFFESNVVPARKALETSINEFVERKQHNFANASHHAHELAATMQGILIAATGVGVLLSAALAWIWFRRLSTQYVREQEATAVATRAVSDRDELLAIVSHDLRNPLAAIMLRASLVEETIPAAKRHGAAISEAAARMEHLIEQLLDVAKLESGRFELHKASCETSALLASTVAIFEARATAANIVLAVENTTPLTIDVDRERILEVLSNLVGNALKFVPATGGTITLRAEPAGNRVRLSVADSGPGVADDQLPHLFERYWQSHPHHKGSLGLGLYICKQIVEAHDGEIGVASHVGVGSTFWFTLPT